MIHNIFTIKRNRTISPLIAAVGIFLILILPLCGLPVNVPGIPIWYQDTFFIALVCGGGVGLFTAFLYIFGRFRRIQWNLIDALVLIILAYSMVRLSFQEAISNTAWIQIIFFGGMYFTGRILFRQLNRIAIPWLLTGFLWGGIAQALYGLGQLYEIWPSHHAAFPVTGSFFNPGPYSGWLACLIPMAIWILFNKRSQDTIDRLARISAWTYLFLGGGVLISAFSRAAWLAGAAGSLVVLWPHIRTYLLPSGQRFNRTLPVVGAFLVILLSALYFFKKDSADGRLLIWSASMDMVSDYPLFGVGWDRFKVMYPRYQAYYFDNGRGSERQAYLAGYEEYPFNEVLGWTLEMGLAGLILILVLGVVLVKRLVPIFKSSTSSPVHLLVLSILSTWLVFSLFSYPTEVPVLAITGVFAFSALITVTPNLNDIRNSLSLRFVNGIILSFLLFSSMYSIYWLRSNHSIVEDWKLANSYFQSGHYQVANSKYITLYPALKNEGQFLQFAGKSMSLSREFYQSRQYLERALYFSSDPVIFTTLGKDYTLFSKVEPENVERAEFLLKMAKYMEPSRYYPRYLLMDLYNRIGKEEKEKEEAIGILGMDTKVESEAVDQIREMAREKLNSPNNFIIKETLQNPKIR